MKKIIIFIFLLTLSFTNSNALESETNLKLILPGKSWALEFNAEGFKLQDQGFLPGFKGRKIQMENPETKLIMSAFLVPAEKKISPAEYRDMVFKSLEKSKFKLSDIKKYEKNDKAFTEYLIKEIQNFKDLNQKNIFIYLTKEDTWIDFHLSKVKFNDSDSMLFNQLINSIKIIDNYIPTSMENFNFGNYFYNNKDYLNATKYYKKALDQEKAKLTLAEEYFLILIDNLGMAYGISGDLKNSKNIFEFGISKKQDYPMFYYNLACTYAEMNDLDNAIKNLTQAFKYKNNMIKGEVIPDPAKDSSFKKFLSTKQFQNFLETIK
jgi:tetratricopeptide (TPR) repeat protein